MRVPRIYQQQALSLHTTIELDDRAFKHIVQVLRCNEGRELVLFNGLGGEYRARLTSVSKRHAFAEIISFNDISRESLLDIHLAQCISKGDRFDFAIQKAVELGVKTITPVISARSQLKLNDERREKKIQNWQQVAISACEQAGRTLTININAPIGLADFIAASSEKNTITRLILHPDSNKKLSDLKLSHAFDVLIGPEGGFEEKEIALAEKMCFEAVCLGQRILRTETAPLVAIAALHALAGLY